jgi:hypothetical protein
MRQALEGRKQGSGPLVLPIDTPSPIPVETKPRQPHRPTGQPVHRSLFTVYCS